MKHQYQPYTYLIRIRPLGLFYYGVEYSNNKWKVAHPLNLGVRYFSHSKLVNQYIKQYGLSEVDFEVRRTFVSAEEAIDWEEKVLRRIRRRDKFVNLNFLNQNLRRPVDREIASRAAILQHAMMSPEEKESRRQKSKKTGSTFGVRNFKDHCNSETCSRGGKKGGARTGETYLKTDRHRNTASTYMSNSIWVTDGKENKRLPAKDQLMFIEQNPGWRSGMTKSRRRTMHERT